MEQEEGSGEPYFTCKTKKGIEIGTIYRTNNEWIVDLDYSILNLQQVLDIADFMVSLNKL
jgi:hypothetical protein